MSQIIDIFAFNIIWALVFFAIAFLLHKNAKYPEPLPPSKNPFREYLEIAIVFGLLFILLII